MERKTKIRILIGVTAVAVVWVLIAFSYKRNRLYKCATCHSWRSADRWWVGHHLGPGLTLWTREIIRESNTYKTLFDANHEHTWVIAHGYCRNIVPFIRTYAHHLSGDARANEFAIFYEQTDTFRDFVHKQIGAGELTRDQLYQIVALPYKSFEQKDTDSHKSKLVELGLRLINEGLYSQP